MQGDFGLLQKKSGAATSNLAQIYGFPETSSSSTRVVPCVGW